MQVKISQATEAIKGFLKAKLVPMLVGSPGCGKSQIVHQIAEEFNLKLIDLRLSQCDPCDLAGFPTVDNGKADYLPMKHFPIEGDSLPLGAEGKEMDGWLLFLDEANSAPPAIQAAAYKLVLDRMVGSHHLHKNVAIVAAGNLDTDNAIVQPMSTAMQSRLAHLELVIDPQEWVNWANVKGIHHHITSYINFKPGSLFTFKSDHTDKTYACPRTWAFADSVIKTMPENSDLLVAMLSGVLSEGVAREFLVYRQIYKELPTLQDMLTKPTTLKVPDEPSIVYALIGSISHNVNKDTIGPLMTYMRRLPMEFQVICLRDMRNRHNNLHTLPEFQAWIADNAAHLF